MKRRIPHIIGVLLAAFLVLKPAVSRGQETSVADMEVQLLQLINAARTNPLGMAWIMGVDPDQVLSDLPWLDDVLNNGLPPLEPDSDLSAAARGHTRDMLDQNYYGYDSLDGRTPEYRISEQGYSPEISGEALGMLGFFNLIEPSKAVFQIFETIYMDELNPGRERPRNILNPDLQDVGIGFGAGKLTLKDVPYNVYLVTCDFATRVPVEDMAPQLVELINQFRARPLEVTLSLGIDPEPLLATRPELFFLLTTPVPPLVSRASLEAAAKVHTRDMLANSFISDLSSDGKSLTDRMAESGYFPVLSAEKIQVLAFPAFSDGSEAEREIMKRMVEEEITTYMESGTKTLLNADFQDIGTALEAGKFLFETGEDYVLMASVTMGTSADWKPLYLVGTVYVDEDGDDLYSVGEGLSGATVTLEKVEDVPAGGLEWQETRTNRAGGFLIPAEPGAQKVSIQVSGEDQAVYFINFDDRNIRLEHQSP